VALVSQSRTGRLGDGFQRPARRRGRARYLIAGLVVVVVLAAAGAILALVSAGAGLSSDSTALAKVSLPFGGGRIQSATVVAGPHSRQLPIEIRNGRIWPRGLIPAHERVAIDVVVKRPGWVSWLTGATQRLHLTVVTPAVALRQNYVTLASAAPLRLSFNQPVAAVSYGPSAAQLTRHVLGSPSTEVTLPRSAEAGTIWVAATPRTWETSSPAAVSWFPEGAATAAVASPAPGTTIGPATPISLTFSKPVSSALGSARPPVSPITAGSWQQVSAHTIVFHPSGYGYGLGASVKIGLPAGVSLIGGQAGGASEARTWTVPAGSTLRLQQLLATLGYLPLRFSPTTGVASTPQAQEAAAIHPPAGAFEWRYGDVPAALRGFWAPGTSGTMTRGAVMAFENDHGLTPDGAAGQQVWRQLISAVGTGHVSSFGYTFVSVSEASQSLSLWHNGRTVLSTPVNTGIASAPTATGTYPVFEHIASGTMSGTNPDGSHYNDTGIPWISYFNGGDALHGFTRAQYGSPQSLGCVEMSFSTAGKVWPYTPVGTLVHVA
jgi:peptidoglycan hydrolase-like protein with peptidoglycan-binding domain